MDATLILRSADLHGKGSIVYESCLHKVSRIRVEVKFIDQSGLNDQVI